MEIRTITVLGAGTMGHGIAHAAIAGGYDTRMYDVSDAAVEKGRAAIAQIAHKGVELGKVSAADAEAMLSRLTPTSSLERALQDADAVIEAAPEKIDLKLQLFADIQRFAPAHAIVATSEPRLYANIIIRKGVIHPPETGKP